MARHMGDILRSFADARRYGVEDYVSQAPQGSLIALQKEWESFDRLCDRVQILISRSREVIYRDIENPNAAKATTAIGAPETAETETKAELEPDLKADEKETQGDAFGDDEMTFDIDLDLFGDEEQPKDEMNDLLNDSAMTENAINETGITDNVMETSIDMDMLADPANSDLNDALDQLVQNGGGIGAPIDIDEDLGLAQDIIALDDDNNP